MNDQTLICESCQQPVLRTSPVQKYCKPCSNDKSLITKTPHLRKRRLERNHAREKIIREIGANISKKERWPLCWKADGYAMNDSDMTKSYRFSIPFTSSLLKNHCWSLSRKGHVFLRKETRDMQDSLIQYISSSGVKFAHNKVWVDICVQKPDMRAGDAINMVDRICDAIKKGIGIDDRWFCISRVDWQIVKENPQIYIGISQPDCVDSQVCAVCGRILPYSNFNKNRGNPRGIGRECKECSSPLDRLKKVQRSSKKLPVDKTNLMS